MQAIDFKKGCYIGQENTARMKLKNKLRRRLYAVKSNKGNLSKGDELSFKEKKIGNILIGDPYPFAIIKLFDPNFEEFKNQEINSSNDKIKIVYYY